SPALVAQFSDGGRANSVTVVGRYAYLANGDDGLRVYDLSYLPFAPDLVRAVGHVYEGGVALGVAVYGARVYLANFDDGLRIYDVSNPSTPLPVGHVSQACCVYGVAVSSHIVGIANGSDGLRLVSLLSGQPVLRLQLTAEAPDMVSGGN